MEPNDIVNNNTIFLTNTGSQAYGMATSSSDLDLKGICLPPISVEQHLFRSFDQAENVPCLVTKFGHLANPANPKIESTVFTLRKFIKLAAEINPNIIEFLWVDDSDILIAEPSYELLRKNRTLFLSSKAKFTFSGYAIAQLNRIKRHRKWLIEPPAKKPERADFGLLETHSSQFDELERALKAKIEVWNLAEFELDEMTRNDIKQVCWDMLKNVANTDVTWSNWPEHYWCGALENLAIEFDLSEGLLDKIRREKAYRIAMENWHGYERWKNERNAIRKELEIKFQYDVKHAAHLVRLLRMGLEILETGKVIVRRPDAAELLAIRNGAWTYEQVEAYAKEMDLKLNEAYKVTTLPKVVDYEKINDLYLTIKAQYQP